MQVVLIIRYLYFTPLESPAIYGGDEIYQSLIPIRKGGVKAPSFITGFSSRKRSVHICSRYASADISNARRIKGIE
jgi:hypothetical protein